MENLKEFKSDLEQAAAFSCAGKVLTSEILRTLSTEETVVSHLIGFAETSRALLIATDNRVLLAAYNLCTKSPVREISNKNIVSVDLQTDWLNCGKIVLYSSSTVITITGCDPIKAQRFVEAIMYGKY